MKDIIAIPVLNEEKNIPKLLQCLQKVKGNFFILFVDNCSTDNSADLLKEFCRKNPNSEYFLEKNLGFAEPLNRAIIEAKSKFSELERIYFLDADAFPDSNWLIAHQDSLAKVDLSVGNTVTANQKDKNKYVQLLSNLFDRHSERAAYAHGHALPWGPTCNLAVRFPLFNSVGLFSGPAAGAFDVDWCWRAILKGATIGYTSKAKVAHVRRNERESALKQFERYGIGEAWLHRTFSFLLDQEDHHEKPIEASVAAYRRLRHHSQASKNKSLQNELEDLAVCFAAGVRIGYATKHTRDSIERKNPGGTIGWTSGKNETTILVPGKGVAQLTGKQNLLWVCFRKTESLAEVAKLAKKLFKINEKDAALFAKEFISGVSP